MNHEYQNYQDQHVSLATYALLRQLLATLAESGALANHQLQAVYQGAQQHLESKADPHALAASLLVEGMRRAHGLDDAG